METKEYTIHSRESGLKFTHINIITIFKKRKYRAEFSFWIDDKFKGKGLPTTIAGNSIAECINKVEEFFQTVLNESEYTII